MIWSSFATIFLDSHKLYQRRNEKRKALAVHVSFCVQILLYIS